MSPLPRFSPLLGVFCVWFLGALAAPAQWLIYELRFTPEAESVNFSFYTGAYVIAPTQGGPATLVLTTEEEGRFYAVSEQGGKFFVAANATAQKAVFSAAALTGTAQAFYTASGPLNRSLLLNSPSGARSWRVAELLTGRLMAADDESERGPSPDGSFGVVGSATFTGTLREDLTANASAAFSTLAGATSYVIELLEKYGYTPDAGGPAPLLDAAPLAPTLPPSVIDPILLPPLETLYRLPPNDG